VAAAAPGEEAIPVLARDSRVGHALGAVTLRLHGDAIPSLSATLEEAARALHVDHRPAPENVVLS
jgi:hypothetical protein